MFVKPVSKLIQISGGAELWEREGGSVANYTVVFIFVCSAKVFHNLCLLPLYIDSEPIKNYTAICNKNLGWGWGNILG